MYPNQFSKKKFRPECHFTNCIAKMVILRFWYRFDTFFRHKYLNKTKNRKNMSFRSRYGLYFSKRIRGFHWNPWKLNFFFRFCRTGSTAVVKGGHVCFTHCIFQDKSEATTFLCLEKSLIIYFTKISMGCPHRFCCPELVTWKKFNVIWIFHFERSSKNIQVLAERLVSFEN